MDNLSNYISKAIDTLKNQLCDRRNQKMVRVNRFAQMERTDVRVGRSGEQMRERRESGEMMRQGRQSEKMRGSRESEDMREGRESESVNREDNRLRPQRDEVETDFLQYQAYFNKPQPTNLNSIGIIATSQYKVNLNQYQQQQTSIQQQQYHKESLRIIQSQIKMDSYEREMNKLYNQFMRLAIEDNKRKRQCWRQLYTRKSRSNGDREQLNMSIGDDDNLQQHQHQQQQQYQLHQQSNIQLQQQLQQLSQHYKYDITNTIELKYTNELINYPQISKSTYTQIKKLWLIGKKHPNYIVKQLKLNFLPKLTARSFRTLNIGMWLNDEIINGYLQMIDNKCLQIQNNYRVLNSFFAQTTFAKSPQVIERVLRRKNITQNNNIIIAINTGNHWLFVQIKNNKIIIHDSIKKNDIKMYVDSSSIKNQIKNIQNFANMFYDQEHIIEIDNNYPQQQNGSDCGMFLLCGIKDIVRYYEQWSFDKDDINYKRYHVAYQLMEEKLQGFQC